MKKKRDVLSILIMLCLLAGRFQNALAQVFSGTVYEGSKGTTTTPLKWINIRLYGSSTSGVLENYLKTIAMSQ